MSARDLREQYTSELLDTISQTSYPSSAVLERFEAAVGDAATLERYVDLLMDRARGRFPNLQLESEELDYQPSITFRSLKSLPVTWQ